MDALDDDDVAAPRNAQGDREDEEFKLTGDEAEDESDMDDASDEE